MKIIKAIYNFIVGDMVILIGVALRRFPPRVSL